VADELPEGMRCTPVVITCGESGAEYHGFLGKRLQLASKLKYAVAAQAGVTNNVGRISLNEPEIDRE
jgi:hypothetical protein